jgi:hypothetical protein
MRPASVLSLLLVVAACRMERREPTADSTRAAATRADSAAVELSPLPPDSAIAWKFVPPVTWAERTRSVLVSAEERARYFQGARAAQRFDYLPQDTTVVGAQTLLLITVYDSVAWTAIDRADEPPVGEVITRERGMVYVASLPQSNPFAEGSADFKDFARRTIDIEQVRKGFQVASS